MSAAKSTRSTQPTLSDFVGTPEELPLADLPTRRNVLQKMMLEKLNDPRYERHIPTMELAGKTGRAVLSLWTQMNTQMTRALVKEKGFSFVDQDGGGDQWWEEESLWKEEKVWAGW